MNAPARTLARLVVFAAAATLAMTVAGPAAASFAPRLDVSVPNTLGTTGKTTIHFTVGSTDDTTARLVLYAPTRFSVSPGTPGTTIGTAKATVRVGDFGGATAPVDGTIEVRDPTGVAVIGTTPVPLSLLALSCTGTTAHAAYWVVKVSAQGQTVELATFLDAITGPEASLWSSKLTLCFPPDDVPSGTPGRSPLGIKLVDAKLTFPSTFTNAATRGAYLWSSIWTPYTPALGTANVAGAVSALSMNFLPVALSLSGKYDKARKSALLSGRFSVLADTKLPLYSGRSRTTLKRSGSTTATTDNGTFAATRKMARTTYYQVRFATPAVENSGICETFAPPLGLPKCVNSTIGAFAVASPIVRVTFRK
jgi:hypothetical protein